MIRTEKRWMSASDPPGTEVQQQTRTVDSVKELSLRISRDGRGGTLEAEGVRGVAGSALVVERVSLVLVKKESSLVRSVPPFSLADTPMSNTCASRWVS